MANRTIYCLRADRQGEDGRPVADEETEESTRWIEPLFCKACGYVITAGDQRIAVTGSHTHAFFNPSGIVFELGCFRRAPGCTVAGAATSEFTWFAGSVWRFALCQRCRAHLGWFYEMEDHAFYGLILTSLTE
jgi:hypothetical protein